MVQRNFSKDDNTTKDKRYHRRRLFYNFLTIGEEIMMMKYLYNSSICFLGYMYSTFSLSRHHENFVSSFVNTPLIGVCLKNEEPGERKKWTRFLRAVDRETSSTWSFDSPLNDFVTWFGERCSFWTQFHSRSDWCFRNRNDLYWYHRRAIRDWTDLRNQTLGVNYEVYWMKTRRRKVLTNQIRSSGQCFSTHVISI